MKKSEIVLSAIFIYLVIIASGGACWYIYSQRPPAQPVAVEHRKAEPTEAEKKAKAEREALKAKEEAEREAKERQEEQRTRQRDSEIERLSQALHKERIRGVTYYTGNYDDKLPGVYLRPILAVDDNVAVLRIEVYYYYTIHDPEATAWIMGNRLDINADGQVMTIAFDPAKLHKKVASDAEWLSEKYMVFADASSAAKLRQAANASSVTITYYQAESGKSRSQTLTATELSELREVMALYDLWSQKMKEENGA